MIYNICVIAFSCCAVVERLSGPPMRWQFKQWPQANFSLRPLYTPLYTLLTQRWRPVLSCFQQPSIFDLLPLSSCLSASSSSSPPPPPPVPHRDMQSQLLTPLNSQNHNQGGIDHNKEDGHCTIFSETCSLCYTCYISVFWPDASARRWLTQTEITK